MLMNKNPSQSDNEADSVRLNTEDLLIVKPCCQAELQFYENAQKYPDFQAWMLECYGSLHTSTESELEMLKHQASNDNVDRLATLQLAPQERTADSQTQPKEEHLCLENIVYGFVRPCVLELTLGDTHPDANLKNASTKDMVESMGLRIASMKVYDTTEQIWSVYPEAFERCLSQDAMLDALLAFFFPSSVYSQNPDLCCKKMPDKEAEKTTKAQKKISGNRKAWILENMIDQVSDMSEFLTSHPELEIKGTSLFLVYEGDKSASDHAWKSMLEEDRREANQEVNEEEDGENPDMPRMYDLRLADFAHSRWNAGRDTQDSDILKGLDHLLKLLQGCLDRQSSEKL